MASIEATRERRATSSPRRARPGRPALGAAIVDRIDCGEQARVRLRALVATLTREQTVGQACAALGVSRARLHAMRNEWLAASAASLEPKRRGRRPHAATDEERRLERLELENERLRRELHVAREMAHLASALACAGRGAAACRDRPPVGKR
ncbi:hypothetical protein KDL67_05540 [bacterium]|nr:hypothetical protein [bacterium]